MTTFLTILDALNDPAILQSELAEDFSGDVLPLDQWSLLDWTLLLQRVDAVLPGVLDKWSVLDQGLAIARINAALAE